MKDYILVLFLVGMVFLSGCVTQTNNKDVAISECVKLCEDALAMSQDLSNGPCLSNEIVEDWVCDVVHYTREAVDNLSENQCSAYGKTAKHFVEVSLSCEFVKAV